MDIMLGNLQAVFKQYSYNAASATVFLRVFFKMRYQQWIIVKIDLIGVIFVGNIQAEFILRQPDGVLKNGA